jgi:hypothetical protein
MTVTMDARYYVQPQVVEGILNKKVDKQLTFKDMFKERLTDATSFRYSEDITTAGADITSGVQGEPVPLTEEADLTEVEISPITFQTGVLGAWGYKIRINPRVLREEGTTDEVLRAYDRVSFGMAHKVNVDYISALQTAANANDITEVAGTAVWSSDDADVIKDIILFKKAFKQEGYPYRMNRIFLHPDNMSEAELYMTGVDRNWAIDPTTTAPLPEIRGVGFTECATDEIAEGAYLGLDSRFPAATTYKFMDPNKSTNPEDNRVMVNRYIEQEYPQRIVIELTMEYGIAVPLKNAVCYRSSGI